MSFGNLLLFIFQIIIAILLILIVLFQSTDEDSLSGIGASAGRGKNLSYQNSANLIGRITIILGTLFILNSFFLTSIYTHKYNKNKNSVVKDYYQEQQKKEKNDNSKK